ncbi:exodeoxyribonuclease III [Candidatus Fermentibacteria bacterium]|nr:exodeoxyribonuclease III [Candidatus Fermentibacteria bacterium]
MKILCWNVNGIRAIHGKGFTEWLLREGADVVCLQETKAHPSQLDPSLIAPAGYRSWWSSAERKGYSGVAVYSKTEPLSVTEGLGIEEFDREGRTLVVDFGGCVLLNLYFPNGGDENRRVPFKLSFCDALLEKAHGLRRAGRSLVICGDFNTAHKEIDLARPKENVTNTGFLPEERAWIDRFVAHGFVDTLRVFHPEPGQYTWWDYKTYARKRNVGWRLDYFFVSEDLILHLREAFIQPEVMGSDHCPVGIVLADEAMSPSR